MNTLNYAAYLVAKTFQRSLGEAAEIQLTIGIFKAYHKNMLLGGYYQFQGENHFHESLFISSSIVFHTRGKMLGGSSGLNGMAWNRASAIEYDSWKNFAPNNDWSWRGLLDFFKKSEHVVQFPQDPFPDYSESIKDATFDLSLVTGFSGPMVVCSNTPNFV